MNDCAVVALQFSNDAARVARREDVGGNVSDDHAARADGRIVANRDTGADDGPAANPDVAANGDGMGQLRPGDALGGVEGVRRGVNLHGGAEHRVLANADNVTVENHAVEVHVDLIAQVEVASVVAVLADSVLSSTPPGR